MNTNPLGPKDDGNGASRSSIMSIIEEYNVLHINAIVSASEEYNVLHINAISINAIIINAHGGFILRSVPIRVPKPIEL